MQLNNFFYKSYYNWWKNIDKTILILILILFGLGLFFSLVSTSLIASDALNTDSYYSFIKHILSYLINHKTLMLHFYLSLLIIIQNMIKLKYLRTF